MNNTKPIGAAETLRAARKVIENPKHWTKGRAATNKMLDWSCSPNSWMATAWCSYGAIKKIDGPWEHEATRFLLKSVRGSIIHFNDNPYTSHADVMKAFDKAIELAEHDGA